MIGRVRRRLQTVSPARPNETGVQNGLSYSLWLPEEQALAQTGIVIIHGAGSLKENHHDFARAAVAAGFGALAFDQRGHGASDGPMDGRVLEDVAAMAGLLRAGLEAPDAPIALRGSSMGGSLAILAAPLARARAVVAICPADPEGLKRGLEAGAFDFDADVAALTRLLSTQDLHSAVESLGLPLLLLHAEGDERVPVQHSRELAQRMNWPGSRLITVPGGHHRSVQHDPELRAVTLRWLAKVLAT
jgi:alpha-beta hydrolase superfamily lysophospholipase